MQKHGAAKPDTPLFVYLPFQSVHGPLEAPDEYMNMYSEVWIVMTAAAAAASLPTLLTRLPRSQVNDTKRQTTCAMITAMDNATKNVIDAYKKAKLWDDTVLVFSTDNGGPLGATGDHNNCTPSQLLPPAAAAAADPPHL